MEAGSRVEPQREIARPEVILHGVPTPQRGWLAWLTTTDHKRIGILYIATAIVFLLVGGVEALIMRLQLAQPDNTLVTPETYNGLVTMHGTTMVFLFIIPLIAGFGNYLVPLMIGARDMAFPKLNALSYWLTLFGGVAFYCSVFFEPPQAGWTMYAPLSDDLYSPSGGVDAWIFLIHLTGHLVAPRRDQLRRDDPQHARARDELGPHAAVRLDDPRVQLPADRRAALGRRGGHDAADRPPLRHLVLRPCRRRRPAPVAAPVLVLRPPRGLHHGAARLRDDLGDPAGVRAQADLRLQGDRGRHGGDRVPRHAGLGAPHVHDADGHGRARLLHAGVVHDRGADRHQDLQLDRHALARLDRLQDAAPTSRRRCRRCS